VFYKHARVERKLREHGRSAPAEILSMRTEGSGNSARGMLAPDDDLTVSWTLCRLELRVMPEGEPPFEVTARTRLNTFKYKGDTVPVLYDPADHDKVVVDYEADARATMEGYERLHATGRPGGAGTFAGDAAAFAEQADEFRQNAAGFRATGEALAAIARAKASGDMAEVERLKAGLAQRTAAEPRDADGRA
jgi:hypothetical protein